MTKMDDASKGCKLLRMYQLLLLDRRRHYQTDLQDFLVCSRQTIIRLASEIQEVIGDNLLTGMDEHRRWYQIGSAGASNAGVETEELRFLALCRDFSKTYLQSSIHDRLEDSIRQLQRILPDAELNLPNQQSTFSCTFFPKGFIDYGPFKETIKTIQEALEAGKICHIAYKALGAKEIREYRVAITQIAAMEGAYYVLGMTVNQKGNGYDFPVSLAIHRIQSISATEERCTAQLPDVPRSMAGLPWHEPKTFRVWFRAGKVRDFISERIWSSQQKLIPQQDGSLIIELSTTSEPELRSWVRSFGEDARLL